MSPWMSFSCVTVSSISVSNSNAYFWRHPDSQKAYVSVQRVAELIASFSYTATRCSDFVHQENALVCVSRTHPNHRGQLLNMLQVQKLSPVPNHLQRYQRACINYSPLWSQSKTYITKSQIVKEIVDRK
jgi:hypothetical protein